VDLVDLVEAMGSTFGYADDDQDGSSLNQKRARNEGKEGETGKKEETTSGRLLACCCTRARKRNLSLSLSRSLSKPKSHQIPISPAVRRRSPLRCLALGERR
jgi:hypothetical protein